MALKWLDLNVKHLVAKERIFWMVEERVQVPLIADKQQYDLSTDTTAASRPANGFAFPIDAVLAKGTSNRTPLDIVYKSTYDRLDRQDTAGAPECVTFDRTGKGLMWIYPVPGETGTYTIELRVQQYSPRFQVCAQAEADFPLGIAWEKWAIKATAMEIGDGPVRQLPEDRLRRWRAEVIDLEDELLAFENLEHRNTPRRVAWRDPALT